MNRAYRSWPPVVVRSTWSKSLTHIILVSPVLRTYDPARSWNRRLQSRRCQYYCRVEIPTGTQEPFVVDWASSIDALCALKPAAILFGRHFNRLETQPETNKVPERLIDVIRSWLLYHQIMVGTCTVTGTGTEILDAIRAIINQHMIVPRILR